MNIWHLICNDNKHSVHLCYSDGCNKIFKNSEGYVKLNFSQSNHSISDFSYCEGCLKKELENMLMELKLKAFK